MQVVNDLLGGLASIGGLSGLAAVLVAVRGMRRHEDAVQEVADQMQPNHGSSLRDAIDRIEQSQQATAERVTALDHRLGHEMGEVRRDVSDVRRDVSDMRADVAAVRRDQRATEARLGAIDAQAARVHADLAHQIQEAR